MVVVAAIIQSERETGHSDSDFETMYFMKETKDETNEQEKGTSSFLVFYTVGQFRLEFFGSSRILSRSEYVTLININ